MTHKSWEIKIIRDVLLTYYTRRFFKRENIHIMNPAGAWGDYTSGMQKWFSVHVREHLYHYNLVFVKTKSLSLSRGRMWYQVPTRVPVVLEKWFTPKGEFWAKYDFTYQVIVSSVLVKYQGSRSNLLWVPWQWCEVVIHYLFWTIIISQAVLLVTMALTPRHRWCIDKIVQCFSHCEGFDDPKVQGFIRRPDVFLQFKVLFSGGERSRDVIFVHYQVRERVNDENAYDRNVTNKVWIWYYFWKIISYHSCADSLSRSSIK